MSEFYYGPKPVSNVGEGGNLRNVGDPEPDVLKAKGLSEAEIAVLDKNENHNKKELEFLENLLNKKGWRAADVLENKFTIDLVSKELPSQFRYSKLKEHLNTLKEQEEKRLRRRA